MKHILLLPIMAFYLFSGSGVIINSFYCCNKLQSVSIFQTGSGKAGCKDQNKLPDCCKNKVQFCKVTDDHFGSSSIHLTTSHFFACTVPNLTITSYNNSYKLFASGVNSHGPPLQSFVPVYILNCNYRI